MAKQTDTQLRGQIVYQVYPRNHTEEGTFRALEADLSRIRDLGVDIIYLMPIHTIGVEGHKGSLGCPYANRDYRAVNPEQGTMEDFIHLTDTIHAMGMKCMIDVVYNHTSPDSVLRYEHPEYFYHRNDGTFGNRFGDWADVIDLDYSNAGLWDYQIATLKMWAKYVDGFRCDVATLIPIEFWKRARTECEKVRPGLIWLAESVHMTFNRMARVAGLHPFTDSEGYDAFDMEYSYDIREKLDHYICGERPLHEYIEALNDQEAIYPENYIKLRCLENHDQIRTASFATDPGQMRNWHAFLFMTKGTVMLYAGEEFSDKNRPSLFDKDMMIRTGNDISEYLKKLIGIRKAYFPVNGWFEAKADDGTECVSVRIGDADCEYVGLFSLKGKPGEIEWSGVSDGTYKDLLSDEEVTVEDGMIHTDGEPVILKIR